MAPTSIISGVLSAVTDVAGGFVFLLSGRELQIVEAPPGADSALRTDRDGLIGQSLLATLGWDLPVASQLAIEKLLDANGLQQSITLRIPKRNQLSRWTSLRLTRIDSSQPRLLGVLLEPQSRRTAGRDALTGLADRRHLEHKLAARHRQIREGARPLAALLFIDLDRFKQVNDTHGHLAGDKVLRVVARRLLAAVRPEDLVARFGGDEFVVLLHDVSSLEEVRAIARRICRRVQKPIRLGGEQLAVSASVGVKPITPQDPSPREALAAADAAMYQAKALRLPANEFSKLVLLGAESI